MARTYEPLVVESRLAQRVFAGTGVWPVLWLVARVWLGYEWLHAGVEKITSAAWMNGTALKGAVTGALTSGTTGAHPAIAYGWYAQFLTWVKDSAYPWMGPAVAIGETVIGSLLILGLFTGIVAFLGVTLNFNYMFMGSAGVNPAFLFVGLLLMLAWRNAGYFGLDRWVLPAVGTPFTRATDPRNGVQRRRLRGHSGTAPA